MKASAKLLLVVLEVTGVGAMSINLSSADGDGLFDIRTTQRCYSFDYQWSDVAKRASWSGVPEGSSVTFYKDVECRGDDVTGTGGTSGSITFEDNFKLAISSFMVQQYSMYPVSGLLYFHQDFDGNAFKAEATSVSGSAGDAFAGAV